MHQSPAGSFAVLSCLILPTALWVGTVTISLHRGGDRGTERYPAFLRLAETGRRWDLNPDLLAAGLVPRCSAPLPPTPLSNPYRAGTLASPSLGTSVPAGIEVHSFIP